MQNNTLTEKLIKKISKSSYSSIIFFATVFVLMSSVPTVYLFACIFEEEYTKFLFVVSMLLPVILTPAIVFLILKLASHLSHVQEYLEVEIEKNRQKDILLFEQARFSLMGEMLANISHQWKQPLNTINLSLIDAKLSQDKERCFDIIEDNVNYLSSTIDDFMSFFDNKSHSEMRELGDIIREIKSIVLTHIKNNNIEFKIELGLDYKDIHIASSISQVVLNLINNAKDSCVSSESKRVITLKLTSEEDSLHLLCCDSGKNIDAEIKEKIFDPYFTTKAKNKGTGIGLYMSKQIVQKVFDGDIYYTEDPKCFNVKLPYSDKCTRGNK